MTTLRVHIIQTEHYLQRYDTVGDWYYSDFSDGDLFVKVSTLPDRREMWLIAIHELIEAALCETAGVDQERVDNFDMSQEPSFEGEPGDQPSAPYYRQHQIASGIERLLAVEMGVDWLTYERHCQEAGQPSPRVESPPQPLIDDDIPF